jgi:hypothetical protein
MKRSGMKQSKTKIADEMRAEYDFSDAVRGKYYERYRASSNIVVLDPDVSQAFPNAMAVNKALRSLVKKRLSVAKRGSRRNGPTKR